MQESWARLHSIFRDVFDDPALEIGETTSAKDIGGWDSLAHVNLIVAIEKEFSIKIRLGETKNLKNVGEMVQLIRAKTQAS